MEEKFFSYKTCDKIDFMTFIFYDVILNIDIGIFKKGKKLKYAQIDFDAGKLHLEHEEYDIELVLKETE